MKHILYIAIMIAATTIALAANSTNDATAIQGKWMIAKAEAGGHSMSDEVARTISLTLGNGKYEVNAGGILTEAHTKSTQQRLPKT